jgi:hypothetical protein
MNCHGIIFRNHQRAGREEGGIEVPTRSSGALAFSNLSHTSSPAVNVKVSIFFIFIVMGIN